MKRSHVENDHKVFALSHRSKNRVAINREGKMAVKPVWGDKQDFNFGLKFAKKVEL